MSDEAEDELISDEALEEQERAMAGMLRARTPEPDPQLLAGVQRKLRERSRGKFYGDGWSTSQAKMSYGLIALVMLMIVVVAYFVLGPTGLV
jgi:hypothetical protein